MSGTGITSKTSHIERTATEPRGQALNTVVVGAVDQINDTVRVIRLDIPPGSPPIRFLPGQWLDVYVPGVEKAGGFTITSLPAQARLPYPRGASEDAGAQQAESALPTIRTDAGGSTSTTSDQKDKTGPFLELAVQKSPDNPPAGWLWNPEVKHVLGHEVRVRVGGSFVWPPPGINVRGAALRRVVFVAGGVGVNALVPMLATAAAAAGRSGTRLEVHFLYSLRDPDPESLVQSAHKMLFVDRIARVFRDKTVNGRFRVFLTNGGAAGAAAVDSRGGVLITAGGDVPFLARRCTMDDVAEAVGIPAERRFAVVYICGVPTMTDDFVAKSTTRPEDGGLGMEPHRVLCEKWW